MRGKQLLYATLASTIPYLSSAYSQEKLIDEKKEIRQEESQLEEEVERNDYSGLIKGLGIILPLGFGTVYAAIHMGKRRRRSDD